MVASLYGHTETLALLLTHKADVHAADEVIIIDRSLEFYFTFELEWKYLSDASFTRWSHRDTRAASGQQSKSACDRSSNHYYLIV